MPVPAASRIALTFWQLLSAHCQFILVQNGPFYINQRIHQSIVLLLQPVNFISLHLQIFFQCFLNGFQVTIFQKLLNHLQRNPDILQLFNNKDILQLFLRIVSNDNYCCPALPASADLSCHNYATGQWKHW